MQWITKKSKTLSAADMMKELLKNENLLPESVSEPNHKEYEKLPHAKFFGFSDSKNNSSKENTMEKYLNSNLSADFTDVINDSELRDIFIRFNTVLPSSAPVERLFSIAGLILSPKRLNLTDELFELLLLLKKNVTYRCLDCQ